MVISVASGKGGTGKTTVAASLSYIIKESVYLDCDVEEPNGHLLLKPMLFSEEKVYKILPHIDEEKCTKCMKCVEVCEFNALADLKFKVLIVDELCNGCGACWYFCDQKAISQTKIEMGTMRTGTINSHGYFIDGVLSIGEPTGVPLISEIKKKIQNNKINIIDSPPGTSCTMIETVKNSDYCLLVTESSPFGLSDLKLAVELVEKSGIPYGVVINKYEPGFIEMDEYLAAKDIEVLLTIPLKKEYARYYSRGVLPLTIDPELKSSFERLCKKLENNLKIVNAC